METMIDGTPFNPAPICQSKDCPQKSCARLYENDEGVERRVDVCRGHARQMWRVYYREIEIIAVWNGMTLEDFDEQR